MSAATTLLGRHAQADSNPDGPHDRPRDGSVVGEFDAWWNLHDQLAILQNQQQIHEQALRPQQILKLHMYIINLDPNKLYGKAITYRMPQSGFTWFTEEH